MDTEQDHLASLPVSNDLFMDLFLRHISADIVLQAQEEKKLKKLGHMTSEHCKWAEGVDDALSQQMSCLFLIGNNCIHV